MVWPQQEMHVFGVEARAHAGTIRSMTTTKDEGSREALSADKVARSESVKFWDESKLNQSEGFL